MQYYLAIDIGASSGRHIIAYLEDGRLMTEEIYRFENKILEDNQALFWDVDTLMAEILNGMKRCREVGKIPHSIGIDTWGVDYLLLDKEGKPLSKAYHYRDNRTDGLIEELKEEISGYDLYQRVGLQELSFNTIYQLLADQKMRPEILAKAESMLLMPSFFNYCLTGIKINEYTHASTTALLDVKKKDWDYELITKLGLPKKIFTKVLPAGKTVGPLTKEVEDLVGFSSTVVLAPSHDTASAYLAVPAKDEEAVFLSSGTWSLLGIESMEPILTTDAYEAQFTNEGGYAYRYRFLKNIMGLWMIQSIRNELDPRPSFASLEQAAIDAQAFPSRVDVNDTRFLAPKSMGEEVKLYCQDSGQAVPSTIGELLACVYQSLADYYKESVAQLEKVTNQTFTSMNIVGGGSKDAYLNQLTADACQFNVYAGPSEGTVIGNILSQMLSSGVLEDIDMARQLVQNSFEINIFEPTRGEHK